jgi:hypothetical protein
VRDGPSLRALKRQYSEDPSRKHGRAGGRPVFFVEK